MKSAVRNLKITLIMVLALLVSPYVCAEPVTIETVRQAANNFLWWEQAAPPKVVLKSGELQENKAAADLLLGEIQPILDDNGEVAAYVQELVPEGFIIIAAADTITPILGFSFSGKWDSDKAKQNPLVDLIVWDVQCRERLLLSPDDPESQKIAAGNMNKWDHCCPNV